MRKRFYSKQRSRVTKRRARKEHTCKECYGDISPREEYYEISYEGDDAQYHTVRVCENCWEGSPLFAELRES